MVGSLLEASFQWLYIHVFDVLLADSSMSYQYAYTGTASILSPFIYLNNETV